MEAEDADKLRWRLRLMLEGASKLLPLSVIADDGDDGDIDGGGGGGSNSY